MSREIDYYALLGVNQEATEPEIRERFRTLARDAHPDRAPSHLRLQAESKFQELAEAVNVLTHPERRKAYDFERAMGAASPSGGDSDAVSENYIRQGITAYGAKRYAEAAGNFSLAVGRDPGDARAQHYLGLAAARSGDLHAAVKALDAAVTLDPQNTRILKDAGAVFRQAGLLVKAEKAYQEAIRWDPSEPEVRKALEDVRAARAGKGA